MCHQGGGPWTNQDPAYQRPHRMDSRNHWTSLLSWDLGRALCLLCAIKGQEKAWLRPLGEAQTWEDMQKEVESLTGIRKQTAGLAHRCFLEEVA